MGIFKRNKGAEIVPANNKIREEALAIPIPDIKQYLVDEFERSKALELRIQGYEQQLEEMKVLDDQYKSAMVMLDELRGRIDSRELTIARREEKIASLNNEVGRLKDTVNTYRIRLNSVATEKEAMREEIVEETRNAIIKKIKEHKGGLSKAAACEIVDQIKVGKE